MCAGVESELPGACPHCGMPLQCAGDGGDAEEARELRDLSWRLALAALLAAPVMTLGMLGGHAMADGGAAWPRWAAGALTTLAVFVAGWPLLARAARSWITLRLNMFTLIGLGVAAAYGFSAFALLLPGLFPAALRGAAHQPPVYWDAASMIVALVLLGQVLEARARRRTGDAIRALMELAPQRARRLLADGGVEEVPLAEVRVGDRLQVRPGDRVPVDGAVVSGVSAVNEAMLTGEPLPVNKGADDKLTGGTLNGDGALAMRAERVGAETVLAQIVALVSQAQRSRAPLQSLVDRVAAIFAPATIIVAALAFAAWMHWGQEPRLARALVSAVSVLLVACPCALGLAAPMSVMVGVGRGARRGILFRDAAALQSLAEVTLVALDKTGTVTRGRPRLLRVMAGAGANEAEVLQTAAALELSSAHSLAAAIVTGARELGLAIPPARDFVSEAGGGLRGRVGGRAAVVGHGRFMKRHGVAPPDNALRATVERMEAQGASVVWVAADGRVLGALAVADTIKPDARAAVQELRALGVEVTLLTGDHSAAARIVAGAVGIARIEAGLDPRAKAERIAALRAEGARVAMVGDGINDAAALAGADASLAMGAGADVAKQTAGIVLVGNDLRAVPAAIRLSRAVRRNIRQNLLWAFGYNLLGLPLAAGALVPLTGWQLSPMLAAAAMSVSSVAVVANALRLRAAKIG